ncbi:MAG: anhydro-N-acetylmuramic acid kinase [Elusimicrobia bacterium]|nr:anhydro-N-acetylmuramic acid kinase [Elusimicrobiota bacterium]MDE2238006.1 anhydro-N-acetylmuramic acid kinase [Elusimicrobiota bacterium]MDE2426563.1 anhydro-N-acetylmuramic acid kinase [Elusimicrobiota bacterium]
MAAQEKAAGLAVGLMSGTSADGVTAALVRFSGRSVTVLRLATRAYRPALKRLVLGAARLTTPELSRLNVALGEAFAEAARALIGRERPEVVGSHGQTVWHGPSARPPNTLQLGEPAVIAERTGLPVVADFRSRDMAAGGQGAPLVPAFDEFLFAEGPLRAVQNIGGIGNVSIVGEGRLRAAFDTGPGNGLMDLAVRLASGGRLAMDEDGRLAARGQADRRLIARLMRHPYFKRKGPKSLDRDDFGEEFLKKHFGTLGRRGLEDVLATLNEFTARTIVAALPQAERCRELVVSGGGALNPELMRNLRRLAAPRRVTTSRAYGLPVMAKEAACFAWLALRAVRGLPNNCPRATGSRGPRILGKIVPA